MSSCSSGSGGGKDMCGGDANDASLWPVTVTWQPVAHHGRCLPSWSSFLNLKRTVMYLISKRKSNSIK